MVQINLESFVRETLDGAIGDRDIESLRDAVAAVEAGLMVFAGRPLTQSETTKVGIETGLQWCARLLRKEKDLFPLRHTCGVCRKPIERPSDLTKIRRATGPEIEVHQACAVNDLNAAMTIALKYGSRGLRAVGR